jgi:hypothetical protein
MLCRPLPHFNGRRGFDKLCSLLGRPLFCCVGRSLRIDVHSLFPWQLLGIKWGFQLHWLRSRNVPSDYRRSALGELHQLSGWHVLSEHRCRSADCVH